MPFRVGRTGARGYDSGIIATNKTSPTLLWNDALAVHSWQSESHKVSKFKNLKQTKDLRVSSYNGFSVSGAWISSPRFLSCQTLTQGLKVWVATPAWQWNAWGTNEKRDWGGSRSQGLLVSLPSVKVSKSRFQGIKLWTSNWSCQAVDVDW